MNIQDITRTIYSIGWEETVLTLKEYQQQDNSDIFCDTWSKKQDNMHEKYLSLWKKANDQHIQFNDVLSFGYPTNGSSESIFLQLTHLNSKNKRLVVFNEEYEGYTMFAKNINMPILTLDKDNIDWESINSENDIFFISQPASNDGNIWEGFTSFMEETEKRDIKVYIDLAYIGLFEHDSVSLLYKNIDGIFFSLSKIFGVYYHRIGGCFLKNENPLLWPMLWFKNLNSIGYGIALLEKQIAGKFKSQLSLNKETQTTICERLSTQLGVIITPSGVPMVATLDYNSNMEWLNGMKRSENPKKVRICISKILETELKRETIK